MSTEDILAEIKSLFQQYAFLHKDIWTLEDVSAFTKKSERTIENHKEEIGYWKNGKTKYFKKQDVEAWITKVRVMSDDERTMQAQKHTSKIKLA